MMKCPVCGKKVIRVEISDQRFHFVDFDDKSTSPFKVHLDAETQPIGMLFRHEEGLCDLQPEHDLFNPLFDLFVFGSGELTEEIADLLND